MRDPAQTLCVIADEVAPSHFLSVFPRWLDRAEWEKGGYPNCSPQEKTERLQKRLNFLRAIDTAAKDMLHYESNYYHGSSIDLNTIRDHYLLGHFEHRYISVNLNFIMATGYLPDDADPLWILTHSNLELVRRLAAQSGLQIIQAEQAGGCGGEKPAS